MVKDGNAFQTAVSAQDRVLRQLGLQIWLGSEPTFTDRRSELGEWLWAALGPEKARRAACALLSLHRRQPGSAVLRTVGRQYPGEAAPRWSVGLFARRDGAAVWDGPPDPFFVEDTSVSEKVLHVFRDELARGLCRHGWAVTPFELEDRKQLWLRLAARRDGRPAPDDPRLARPMLHTQAIPLEGSVDGLAVEGTFLFAVGESTPPAAESRSACIELPACADVETFALFLSLAAAAARRACVPSLAVLGYPPPTDDSVRWTTLTPDPAVVEANMAPEPDLQAYYASMRAIFAAAADAGLSPLRYHYNGGIADSGGGGHITLGGPTPAQSPFVRQPYLLPRVVCYFNRHPALSYYLAREDVGSSGQSPRADEGLRESFHELRLALDLLERRPDATVEEVSAALAPFLSDHAGNSHRAEINVEKLCNPALPNRGRLGVVEFRAVRMARSPEWSTAAAALLRAVAAMLMRGPRASGLVDWGDTLHDRFALPFFLREDLKAVLRDLDDAGVGLPDALARVLLDDVSRLVGELVVGEARLTLEHALEFWPLAGSLAGQETETARVMDSSTRRLQLLLHPGPEGVAAWRLFAGAYRLPLRTERSGEAEVGLIALRYRAFVPSPGLHPCLGAQSPLRLVLACEDRAWSVVLHEWRASGGAYTGLPADAAEAAARRAERVVSTVLGEMPGAGQPLPPSALTPFCVDLRRLPAAVDPPV